MIKSIAFSCLHLLGLLSLQAQDFDKDSIYYTPLERNLNKKDSQPTELSRKHNYFFTVLSGTLIGSSGVSSEGFASYSFSTTHGIRLGKRLGLGAGVGYDSYLNWNAMPIFASLSYDVIGKKNKLFVQLNYGKSLIKKAENQYEYSVSTYEGRSMINPSLGYKFVYENLRLYVQAGLKVQNITIRSEYPIYYTYSYRSIAPLPNTTFSKTDLTLNRFYFSIGFGWK